MARALAVFVAAVVVSLPALAQSPAVRWSAAACRGRGVYPDSRQASATVENGRVHVRVEDASGALVGERTVDGPHWRTRAGADCEAMGIASTDFVRVHGQLAVRVEVSVGDLCDQRAPRCAVVAVP